MSTYRLSSQQCALHVERWQDDAPVTAVVAEGPGNAQALSDMEATMKRLVARHEILRTLYRAVPGLHYPVQSVAPALDPAWSMLEPGADATLLLRAARSAIDLQSGPVIGVAACLLSGERVRLALAVPSQNLDVASVQDLLAACLRGDAGDGEVLQYPDYLAWQQDLLAGELGREGAGFWQAQGTAAPRLPFEITGAEGLVTRTRELGEAALREATALAARMNVSVPTVLVGVWAGHIGRITQDRDVAFEWRCDARPEELAGALGCFDSLLPIAASLDEAQPVDALVRVIDERVHAAKSWHECFDAAAWLESQALNGRSQAGVVFSCTRLAALPQAWRLTQLAVDPGAASLRCDCIEADGRWMLRWSSPGRHAAATLDAWMRQFETLLQGLGRHAAVPWRDHPLLSAAEREHILATAATAVTASSRVDATTLHALFEAQGRRTPDAIAVLGGDEQLSYRELDGRADQLARRLRALGARPEQLVGVHLGRSVHAIVAMLGVMKSGAAYVPLDPAYPPERIALMVEDAGIAVVVVDGAGAPALQGRAVALLDITDASTEREAADGPWHAVVPGHLAYLIYTSGSTGRPKGVMVSHANAVASTTARFAFYREPVERFLLLSSFSFDSSVAGIFWTLGQGGTLCLPTDDAHRDPSRIAATVMRHRISHLLALPSFYRQIAEQLEAAAGGNPLRCAIVAGEACHADVVECHRQHAKGSALVNEYGPTEGTVWSNGHRIERTSAEGQRVPIGRAIPSMRSLVLDAQLEPCAIGVPGELYIGGEGITRGYRERPGLTAQRFVADPFVPGERLYRTSDLARLRPDGEIEYLGRADHQVKLRGHRIELGEIEAALLADEQVREAVVLLHEDKDLGQRLVACVSSQADAAMLSSSLDARLRRRLPGFMVPAQIAVLPRLPAMPNGKVDRQALLALGAGGQRPAFVAPCSAVECTLAAIWEDVLKTERIGLDDGFFDLGGHSLLATQVTSRIRQRLAVDIPLRALFEAATLRALAARVEAQVAAGRDDLNAMDELLANAEGVQ